MLRISSQQRGSPDEQQKYPIHGTKPFKQFRRADHRYPRGNTEKRVTEMEKRSPTDRPCDGEFVLLLNGEVTVPLRKLCYVNEKASFHSISIRNGGGPASRAL